MVVPAKGRLGAKTRLGATLDEETRGRLALAFLADTVSAAVAVPSVREVLIVSDAPEAADLVRELADPRVVLVAEGGAHGLNAAIARGLDAARTQHPRLGRAVLLGDHPALAVAELAAALRAASVHSRALVADADGTGTALATARPGVPFEPAFGGRSAAAHAASGHVPLDGVWPTL
ncbi:2-phospho-L-lactate guanylyltransferase, partial [Agromyces seonyuensis]|uniref:2-phospho-L-lactate guanylyltransferase n=1 Tax=Agromyces seonyuensis TaxID=2662446 RepID=UPI00136673FB